MIQFLFIDFSEVLIKVYKKRHHLWYSPLDFTRIQVGVEHWIIRFKFTLSTVLTTKNSLYNPSCSLKHAINGKKYQNDPYAPCHHKYHGCSLDLTLKILNRWCKLPICNHHNYDNSSEVRRQAKEISTNT